MSEELISSQLIHTIDLIRAELKLMNRNIEHYQQLTDARFNVLERSAADYESRLRKLHDIATQFKLLASLATGGGFLSLINLIKQLI
jgi:hypothetical protein